MMRRKRKKVEAKAVDPELHAEWSDAVALDREDRKPTAEIVRLVPRAPVHPLEAWWRLWWSMWGVRL